LRPDWNRANFCLRELMKRDFRLELPEVDPLALLDDETARERYETAVRDAVRNESGWGVWSDAVLGQFRFQKLAIYDDYGRHATEIAEHEHCRRIAGDDSTPPPFALAIPSPERFDAEVHPCLPEAGCGYSFPLTVSALPDHATTLRAFRRPAGGTAELASTSGTTTVSLTDLGPLTTGVTYEFWLVGHNSQGNGPQSNHVSHVAT